jgi:predicted RecB family nuclease
MIKHYSNSSTTTFRRCTFRFHQLYMLSEEYDVEVLQGVGIRLGKAGHLAMKAFYSGEHYKVAEDHAYEEFSPQSEDELKDFNRLRAALTYYWSATLADRWKVLKVEEEVKTGKYMGILDLVVKTPSGQTYIVDHKFQKSRRTTHLHLNTQISFYLLLAQKIGLRVDGLLYNIIPMDTDKPSPPIRKLCFRTPIFLANFEQELDTQIQIMEQFQEEPKPVRNFTEDCLWDCSIREYCLSSMERK